MSPNFENSLNKQQGHLNKLEYYWKVCFHSILLNGKKKKNIKIEIASCSGGIIFVSISQTRCLVIVFYTPREM